jgi:hypothetical protein
MKTLQRMIGVITSVISIFTVCVNISHPQALHPDHTIAGIVTGVLGLLWFGSSVFLDKLFLRIGQVVIISIVAILTICLNLTEYLPYSLMGIVMFFFAITLAWAYDLFDKAPLIIIAVSTVVMFVTSTLLLNSAISGSAMTAITIAVAASFWAVAQTKIKRFRKMALDYRELAKSIDHGDKDG